MNLYLVADDTGFVLIDTGLGNRRTLDTWRTLLAGPLKPYPISRIVVTHFHPDHVGAVGWLAKELQVPVYMPTTEYLMAQITNLDPGAMEQPHHRAFYREHGLSQETVDNVVTKGHEYLRLVSGLPHTYRRLIAGDTLKIGARQFEVLTGGHSPEQAMLLSRDDGIFLAADQCWRRSRRMSACTPPIPRVIRSASTSARCASCRRRYRRTRSSCPDTSCRSAVSRSASRS